MTMITRAVIGMSITYWNLLQAFNQNVRGIRKQIAVWRDRQLGNLFAWALSKRPVQQAVADAFNGSTPMCAVLRHAVNNVVDETTTDFEVDADNVRGLDRFLENMIENSIEPDSIKNFDEAVNQAIDLDTIEEEMMSRIRERLRG